MNNANGQPDCFFSDVPLTSKVGKNTSSTFWRKPVRKQTGACNFTVDVGGVLNVKTTLRALGVDEGSVEIRVDGVIMKRCGDMQPFVTGTAPTGGAGLG